MRFGVVKGHVIDGHVNARLVHPSKSQVAVSKPIACVTRSGKRGQALEQKRNIAPRILLGEVSGLQPQLGHRNVCSRPARHQRNLIERGGAQAVVDLRRGFFGNPLSLGGGQGQQQAGQQKN